jgi:TonB family protein
MKPEISPSALPKIGPSDRLGAVVPASEATALAGADLTNVIVLARRRNASGIDAPAVTVKDGERPAPAQSWHDTTPWTALIAAALLLHLALVLFFMRDPAPMPSLALDSISVDIVLGGQTEAGVSQAPSPAESAPSLASENPPEAPEQPSEITEQTRPELRPRIEAAEPPREEPKPDEQKFEQSKAAAAKPEPAAEAAEPEPTPVSAESAQVAAVAAAAEVEPVQKVQETEYPKPVEQTVESGPPPQQEPTEQPREQSKPAPPAVAASRSGVGIGSSREVRNWAARVSAYLARNKRYPTDALARGIGGTASIAFTVDADGRVTSIRLVRSSGNASLDRESQDLVRRAAPFPPPPQGKASITVPVNFNVRTGR